MKVIRLVLLCTLIIATQKFNYSQNARVIDQQTKAKTIEKLADMLEDYVYPEIGEKVIHHLHLKLKDGNYDTIDSFENFGRTITKDMFSISNDKHLLIRYDPEYVKELINQTDLIKSKDFIDQQKKASSQRNFGFKEVRVLPSNIGYIRFNEFEKIEFAAQKAHSVIAFVAETDALIIDLRNNNGGWGSMVQLLCSYFFDFQDELNNQVLFEKQITYQQELRQYRVLPDLPGKRILNIPIYILTSKQTYSAAEAFTSVLQQRKRAIIVGEQTRGGAHSTRGPEILTSNYIVKMPVARVQNAITKNNWEGTGLKPDILVAKKDAVQTALINILNPQIVRLSEDGLNKLGYSFLNENMVDIAIYIFKKNTEKYPSSSNCEDSLAEAYMTNNQIDLAIHHYEKCLTLNPTNTNAKAMINKMREKLNLKKKV